MEALSSAREGVGCIPVCPHWREPVPSHEPAGPQPAHPASPGPAHGEALGPWPARSGFVDVLKEGSDQINGSQDKPSKCNSCSLSKELLKETIFISLSSKELTLFPTGSMSAHFKLWALEPRGSDNHWKCRSLVVLEIKVGQLSFFCTFACMLEPDSLSQMSVTCVGGLVTSKQS